MKTLKPHYLFTLYLFIVLVSLVIGPSVLASQSPNITVETSKASYLAEENIEVYGNLTYDGSPVPERLVSLEVQDPSGSPVVIRNLETDANGKYNLTFKLASDARLGTYTVYVSSSYKGETATNNTIFELYEPSTQYLWPMFRHNLRHTGYTESPAPNTNQTQWNYTTGNRVFSSPAVADGKVYVGSDDARVYCLDASTGAHIWNYTTGAEVFSSPAVADGIVFVGSNDSKVYALDQHTGAHIWSYTTASSVRSCPAVADGKVYVGSDDARVYCLDASTGAHIWNYTTGNRVFSSPAVADGKVYVGSDDARVYCLDASTGAHIWNYTTGAEVFSSPAVADGIVFVGSNDSKVYALDQHTGAHIWSYTTASSVRSCPAVADGKVYVGSIDKNVYCLDALTGAHIWSYTTGGVVWSSPAVADDKVFVGSFDDKVYCLDALTGAHIWSYTTGGVVWSSPAVADGVVFVGSNDNVVYAFGNVVRVPEDYPTIPEAVEAATPGATITIAPGTHYDPLIIDKPLTILGKTGSATEFDGGGSGIAITLLPGASGSTVTGIVITNWDQGILMINSSDCKIYDNIFHDNTIAINLTESSITNTIYWNSFINNEVQVSETSLNNIWDNDYPSGGNYWSTHISEDLCSGPNQNEPGSDGIFDTQYTIVGNNIDRYPLVKPFSPHDIGITNITTSKTVVCQSYQLNINVTILNYCIDTETFSITVYAYTEVITQTQITLKSRNSTTITFTWNTTGFALGNYTISAYAWPVPGETDTADNTFVGDSVKVAIPGDVNGDGIVDIFDAVIIALAFGSSPDDPNWDPRADINEDNLIDIFDIVIVALHFGETEP